MNGPQNLSHPLMENNITSDDRQVLIDFLSSDSKLTNGPKVKEFEDKWSKWLGVRHSLMVNSGSSANLITLAALNIMDGEGEVIVPSLTWVSDIASTLQNNFKPVFVDSNPKNLGMDTDQVLNKVTDQTKAIFLTHILGFNALDEKLLRVCRERNIRLIEDVCESHGATYEGRRLGSFGWASNFSFYYAHHMSTIEGGMVCTNDTDLYHLLRCLRSHGMVREADSDSFISSYSEKYPDLNPSFIFAHAAYNVRSTEINAVLGLHQLERLDTNNEKRVKNFQHFLDHLNPKYFETDFDTQGAVNYGLVILLKEANESRRIYLERGMTESGIEFRRGTSGGGNQLRQPYLRNLFGDSYHKEFPHTDHVHFYGYYIGNYPDLNNEKIIAICNRLNQLAEEAPSE